MGHRILLKCLEIRNSKHFNFHNKECNDNFNEWHLFNNANNALWITYTDIRSRTISNKAIVAIFVTSIPIALYHHNTINILAALSFLTLGFILFNFNICL